MPDLLRNPPEPDYRCFILDGHHYACGFKMGVSTEFRTIPERRGQSHDPLFAEACARAVFSCHPPLEDEFLGYAHAQQRAWSDILPHFSLNHPAGVVGGCSTAVWRSPSGHLMIARNYDYATSQKARHLLRASLAGVLPTIGTNAGLIAGRYDGVNAAGLFVALHLVQTNIPDRVGPGIPFHLIPRILLETCSSAAEAMERLLEMPVLHSFNYLMADKDQIIVVETHPARKRVRRATQLCVVTNHFEHTDMQELQGTRTNQHSKRRSAQLIALIASAGQYPWEQMPGLLSNHVTPLCHHEPHLSTLWAVIADLTSRKIAYCMGAPCQTPFVECPWPAHA